MKEDDIFYRVTLFSILIIYFVEPVRANLFTTTPIYDMEDQIIDSLRKQISMSQSTTVKNQEIRFRLGKSVSDKGNYLQSTRYNTPIGYGLFVRSDYFKNNSSEHSTHDLKSSNPAQNSNILNTYYSTHKTSIDPNIFQKNKESQIEKYQAVNTENKKNNNYDHYADRIKYLIMGDENVMKATNPNLSQNRIAVSSLVSNSSNFKMREQDVESSKIPLKPSNKLTNTMIVDQHTRIMLQMNHDVNKDKLLNSDGKKEIIEDFKNNSTTHFGNESINNTRAGHKNHVLEISDHFGRNRSYGLNINHGENSRFNYQDHVGLLQSSNQDTHKVHTYPKFEPYSNSHMNSEAMYECKSCRINSQQIHSPMTNHMRDREIVGNSMNSNKNTNSGQGSIVPMNNNIRNSPQGYSTGGFKVNTTNQRVVVNNLMNPNKYDTLGANSMNVNKFEMGVGMNPSPMTPHRIKNAANIMETHPMQSNNHMMQQSNSHKQVLSPVDNVMKQNMPYNGNGYSYIPPNSNQVNAHEISGLHDDNVVSDEHIMMPYNYKIPNMMHKPHVDSHSQKDYMGQMDHHGMQSSMMSRPLDSDHKDKNMKEHYYHYDKPSTGLVKPHNLFHDSDNHEKDKNIMKEHYHHYDKPNTGFGRPHNEANHFHNSDNHEKDQNMMKEHYYHYDKPSTGLVKPHDETHVQNSMEKGNFMEQMMMLMMMKFSEHMAPNNVINLHVGSDKHDSDRIKMEPMMKFNRIHPMLPMVPMHKTSSPMPDKKEEDKYAMVKMPYMHPGHKEEEKYVMVKMPEPTIDHSYISHSPIGWMTEWYPSIIFPDKKKILTVIFLIVVIILTKKLLLALAVIKFFLAIVPVLAFILLLKQYLFYFLISKGFKFFKWFKKFKKVPLFFAVSPLFFFPIIIPFFYLVKGETTYYTVTYPTFTYPTFTYPTFTFPTFTFPTFTFPPFPTNPETTGRTDEPPTTQTLTTTTMTTLTTTTTMATTMTETMTTNTESQTMSMGSQTMSMGTQPMSMATQQMSSSSMSMSMSMASPPMSMATQAMTMSGRIGVVKPTMKPSRKTTLPMKGIGNGVRLTKLPALTQYKNDINSYIFEPQIKKTTPMSIASTQYENRINSYKFNSPMKQITRKYNASTQYKNGMNLYKLESPIKKTTPMSSTGTQYKNRPKPNSNKYRSTTKKTTSISRASTGKKQSTLITMTFINMKHPLRWNGVTNKPQPTKSMDKLVTNKQKTSTYNRNCGGNNKTCKIIKKNNQVAPGGNDKKYHKNSSLNDLKIGSLQQMNKVDLKNTITNRDRQKLKNVLRNEVKILNLNKRKDKTYESEELEDENTSEDISNGIAILRERFPRQSSSFLSLFNRMWSALASERCMERIGCHLAVNSKSVRNYNALIIRVLQSLFSRRPNRRIRSYIKAYQLGSKKGSSHLLCRYKFPCLGILKI